MFHKKTSQKSRDTVPLKVLLINYLLGICNTSYDSVRLYARLLTEYRNPCISIYLLSPTFQI
jgi:hypothetical protein